MEWIIDAEGGYAFDKNGVGDCGGYVVIGVCAYD
jgi:hypothetical protein